MRAELERASPPRSAGPSRWQWRFTDPGVRKRAAIMVSRYDHCMLDLLWRARRDELDLDVGLVISNHADLAADVRSFGVPFVHIPVTKATKAEAERRQLELLAGNFDLVVMARYMQILSAEFLDAVAVPVINIHHSFLPSFAGAGPHARARARGVKLIGATAHYATEDSTRARSSSRTSCASRTTTAPRSCSAAAPTSSARSWPAPCSGTARTASCATASAASSLSVSFRGATR